VAVGFVGAALGADDVARLDGRDAQHARARALGLDRGELGVVEEAGDASAQLVALLRDLQHRALRVVVQQLQTLQRRAHLLHDVSPRRIQLRRVRAGAVVSSRRRRHRRRRERRREAQSRRVARQLRRRRRRNDEAALAAARRLLLKRRRLLGR